MRKARITPTLAILVRLDRRIWCFTKRCRRILSRVEGGMYGYERGVFGVSQKLGEGNLLYGGEAYHDDGPWVHPDDYWKFNGLLTYSQGDDANGCSVTARGYHGEWNSSDQIPASFGADQFLWRDQSDRRRQFAALQPASRMASPRRNSETKITAYAFYYDLDLFSDFTYFLTDTNQRRPI